MATTEETNDTTTTQKPKDVREMPNAGRITTLVAGDALAFLIFATIGRGNHGEATGLAALPEVVITAAPFAIGWFIVAPFVGAFRRKLVTQPRTMATRTALAWALSWPIGLGLRWLFKGYPPPPSFAIVTLIANLVILLVWRWPFALINSARKR